MAERSQEEGTASGGVSSQDISKTHKNISKQEDLSAKKSLPARYKVLKVVGEGGAGVVFKVKDTLLDKIVAIKTLHSAASANEVLRFQREAQLAGALNHPNVMGVIDFGLTDESEPYIVLNFVEGESLATRLKRSGALPVGEALKLFLQIAAGLTHAHNRSIIHRDIKPSNVMLINKDDRVVAQIVDFGLAKIEKEQQRLTAPGGGIGTPTFMSPEQITGSEIDHRADIYSFGCLMFQVLTGQPPFLGDTALDTMQLHLTESPPLLREKSHQPISEPMEEIVSKCLEKDPAYRFQSVEEITDRLNVEIERLDVADAVISPIVTKSKPVLSKREIAMIASVLLVLAAVTALLLQVATNNVSLSKVNGSNLNALFIKVPGGDIDSESSIIGTKFGGNAQSGSVHSGNSVTRNEAQKYFVYTQIKSTWTADFETTDRILRVFAEDLSKSKPVNFELSASNVTPRGLKALAGCNIEMLHFRDHPINDQFFEAISRIKQLRSIDVGETSDVDLSSMPLLNQLPEFRGFGMHAVTLTQEMLDSIASVKNLQRVDLSGTTNSSQLDWSVFKQLKLVREFKLDHVQLTDRQLAVLTETGAQRLGLKCVKVSDASVPLLLAMPSLHYMEIMDSRKFISRGAIRKLRQKKNFWMLYDNKVSKLDHLN